MGAGERARKGETIAHFRIIEKLGEGGMGVVYRAQDEKLGRVVALKVLPDDFVGDVERRHRFLREARSAAAVTHQNIATVYEVGEKDERIYIAMEYVEGHSLRTLIEAGPVPVERATRLARGILTGLAKAHAAGVIHRDLKPDNVMIGDDDHVKILDFGLAKLDDSGSRGLADTKPQNDAPTVISLATKEGRVLGTPHYMSPEQAAGRAIDRRTDIFSMGVVLFEMLTGKRPFEGTTALELIAAIQRDTPPAPSTLNPAVPESLDRVLAKAFEKDPQRRYGSCKEMLGDLPSGETSSSSAATAASRPSAPAPVLPKRFFLPVVILAAAIAAALTAFAFVAQHPAGAIPDAEAPLTVTSTPATPSSSTAPSSSTPSSSDLPDAAASIIADAMPAAVSSKPAVAPRPSTSPTRPLGSPPPSSSRPVPGMSETQK